VCAGRAWRANADSNKLEGQLSPLPFDTTGDAANRLRGKCGKGGRTEIKISWGAARTAVNDFDSNGLALVSDIDLLVTDGVVVGIGTCAGNNVKEQLRNGGYIVGIGISLPASSETECVISEVSGLGSSEEATKRITSTAVSIATATVGRLSRFGLRGGGRRRLVCSVRDLCRSRSWSSCGLYLFGSRSGVCARVGGSDERSGWG